MQDIAQLKGFRFESITMDQDKTLQNKISDTERSYFACKMVVAKAAQLGEQMKISCTSADASVDLRHCFFMLCDCVHVYTIYFG